MFYIPSIISEVSHNSTASNSLDVNNLGGVVIESLNSLITTIRFDGMNFLARSSSTNLYITRKGRSGCLTGDVKMLNPNDFMFTK